MKKVRWGIMSTADIGLKKVIPAMQKAESVDVAAIASRREDAAKSAAKALGIAKTFGGYEALLDSDNIDAVYIPLPNHLHVEWAIKALEAGKHVLCEKPIGLSSAQGEQLLQAAAAYPGLKAMEGFMYRHHPQWIEAKRLVDTGALGELRTIQSFFSYYNVDAGNIRNKPEAGGGAMMDIGCYCISLSRFLCDAEPDSVFGLVDRDPAFGTDRLFSGIMRFGPRTSTFTCSTQLEDQQRVFIQGDKGGIEIMIPFNAPPDEPCVMILSQGEMAQTITFPICDQYTIQAELMSRAILDNTEVPTPLTDAVANMKAHEALMQSAETSTWVNL